MFWKKVLPEIVILISTVFVFRGLWTMLDRFYILKTNAGLAVSIIAGLAVTVCTLYWLHRGEGG